MSQSSTSYTAIVSAPFAHIGLVLREGKLLSVDFIYNEAPALPAETAGSQPLQDELQHYLADSSYLPRFERVVQGTAFQQRVWRALQAIPPGETRSYGQLARQLNSSARAVGNACRANPTPLFVPCHRVVGKHGPGGFGGHTDGPAMRAKRWLLEHEGAL